MGDGKVIVSGFLVPVHDLGAEPQRLGRAFAVANSEPGSLLQVLHDFVLEPRDA